MEESGKIVAESHLELDERIRKRASSKREMGPANGEYGSVCLLREKRQQEAIELLGFFEHQEVARSGN